MGGIRKIAGIALCFALLLALAMPAAAEQSNTDGIVRDMIGYYFHYRDQASAEIENQLEILSDIDAGKGAAWTKIMDYWKWANTDMEVTLEALPEGLPQDDTLCIVVLGYGLNRDGSMKPELISRLEAALASAEKYPQAYVLCTGGETSDVAGISEAGQMGAWLREQGIGKDRLLLETKSLSTTENARNCCRLLRRDYPQVRSVAIVSSDYHIPWGSTLFAAEAVLQGMPVAVVGNAACQTDKSNTDSMYSQAWGLSILAGVTFDGTYVPPLYMSEETIPTQTAVMPAAASLPVAEETPEEPVIPVLLCLAAFLAFLFFPKKRKTSGSD